MRLRRWTISCALHKNLDLQFFSARRTHFREEWGSRTKVFRHTGLKSYNGDQRASKVPLTSPITRRFSQLSSKVTGSAAPASFSRTNASFWQCFSRRPSYRDSEANRHSVTRILTANALRSLSELSRTAITRSSCSYHG